MEFYVVVSLMMNGRDASGIFSTFEKAQQYMEKLKDVCRIEKLYVRGNYEFPNSVFAAQVYDRGSDIHVLEGIYSDEQTARGAAGHLGQILEFIPDDTPAKNIMLHHVKR